MLAALIHRGVEDQSASDSNDSKGGQSICPAFCLRPDPDPDNIIIYQDTGTSATINDERGDYQQFPPPGPITTARPSLQQQKLPFRKQLL
jgi:hypothetical protein